MIRIVASDMDGTLLNASHQISQRNIQAIIELQKRDIMVVVATGRNYPEAVSPLEQAGLILPNICINGAEVRSKHGRVLSSIYIEKNTITKIIDILEEHNVYFELFIDDCVYTEDVEKQIGMFIKVGKTSHPNPPVDKIRTAVMERVKRGHVKQVTSYASVLKESSHKINKVLGICDNDQKFTQTSEVLRHIDGLAISSSGEGVIEITDQYAQKGVAIENYANRIGVSMEEVLVIGDSYNDISMMERAGISIAMANAPNDVKDVCMFETTSCDEDGFAEAMEKLLL